MDFESALVIDEMDGAEREAVIALWTRCGLTRPWNDPVADMALAETTENATVLVARRNGRIVGAAMTGHDGHRGALYYLGVDPDQRCGGVGRALVEAAEGWCRARGAPKLNLLVRSENQAVLAFYAALGYRPTDSISLYRTLDPEREEREREQKAEWAARSRR
ncbi:GNAT family acetyltransferase [Pleomorphomonas sp. NRKKF1]|uniref:GNAT family acetyltransferase n=1 Tax=Pleomorphomonas sp. NRK KF1 TaxID=2943000 RepID=UPI0020437E66|nr:GNAT family acetyltransferase [Pleomorphomonas sp. NRK KF1]